MAVTTNKYLYTDDGGTASPEHKANMAALANQAKKAGHTQQGRGILEMCHQPHAFINIYT